MFRFLPLQNGFIMLVGLRWDTKKGNPPTSCPGISKKEAAGRQMLPLKDCVLSRTNKYRPMIDVAMSFILRAKLTKNRDITKSLPHKSLICG